MANEKCEEKNVNLSPLIRDVQLIKFSLEKIYWFLFVAFVPNIT